MRLFADPVFFDLVLEQALGDSKMFGSMGLMFAFIIGQSLFLSKYMKDAE